MHELSLAHSIAEIALEALRGQPPEVPLRVAVVRVRVGDLSGVDPEALEFCFEVVRKGWVETAEATLEIRHCPARVRCRQCGEEYELTVEASGCGSCGAWMPETIGGRELEVCGVELREVAA